MRKTTNTMQLCPQGVYGISHQSYKLTIYNLLHLGQILVWQTQKFWQAIEIALITDDLFLKRVRKSLNTEFKKNNYLYIRINCQFFIHNVSNFLAVLFKGVKCVLYCLVYCLLNFFTNFFNLVCTSCWLPKYNIKNHASKPVGVNKVHLWFNTKTVPLFMTYIWNAISINIVKPSEC